MQGLILSMTRPSQRSTDSPLFLAFGVALGTAGLSLLIAGTSGLSRADLAPVLLLGAIALAMRLNTFTIPPRIVVSLVYPVTMAAVLLVGGVEAAWICVATFLASSVIRKPPHVSARVFLAVVSFNVGMESLMGLAAGGARRFVLGDSGASGAPSLLSLRGGLSVLAVAVVLKLVNETLMTIGSYLRGSPMEDYLAGARRVLPVEVGMIPLGLLLALVGSASGERGLLVAAVVLVLASILVKRLSATRDELQRINLNLERRLGELDVLGRVSRAISGAIEIEPVLEAIHRYCSELIDARNFLIGLVDRARSELDIVFHVEDGQRLGEQRLPLGKGLATVVIERREPLLIGDIEREAGALPIKPVQISPYMTRSWLGVPLIAGDEVLGVIIVQDEKPEAYDEATVRVLTTIAAQAAITIRNAQLVRHTLDQARLEEENRYLRLVDQRKNEFVGMVAHQLQSPLTAIIGFSGLIGRQDVPPSAAEHLALIHSESRRLSELVEQLLSLSRIRSGKIQAARRRVDLNAIAREVIDGQVLVIRERQVRIDLALAPGGCEVEGDPALLHQAVANLLNNAIKYSPVASAITIRTEIRGPAARADGRLAVLSVRDRGPGVPEEDRARIFDEFYRARSAGTMHVHGSGLGLTIAREIAEIHGGRITYEPATGGGSVFSFELPTAAA